MTIHDVYAALVDDTAPNEMITADLIRAVENGRSPLLLTGEPSISSDSGDRQLHRRGV